MHKTAAIALAIIFAFVAIERIYVSEEVRYIERELRIERGHRHLRKGMSRAEVLREIGIKPDRVIEHSEESNTSVLYWSPEGHDGPIHTFFGKTVRDPKSGTDLWLDFDAEDRLIRILYGG
jgi:hypothetical protein